MRLIAMAVLAVSCAVPAAAGPYPETLKAEDVEAGLESRYSEAIENMTRVRSGRDRAVYEALSVAERTIPSDRATIAAERKAGPLTCRKHVPAVPMPGAYPLWSCELSGEGAFEAVYDALNVEAEPMLETHNTVMVKRVGPLRCTRADRAERRGSKAEYFCALNYPRSSPSR